MEMKITQWMARSISVTVRYVVDGLDDAPLGIESNTSKRICSRALQMSREMFHFIINPKQKEFHGETVGKRDITAMIESH
jgi:hypothetical protein